VEVVHDAPWSRVLRVPTADEDLYLKQCAPVQAFEVPLTVALAARWPDRVPQVVAADTERAWLLLRDAGTRLRESGDLGTFTRALELYGELQREEVAHADEFLALGVPDVRLPTVAGAYEPFFEDDRGLERDEVARLRVFAPRFHELCAELEAFGLPDSIQHDDLHDGNVFVRDGRVAIFDWGDSSVAHPLWSLVKPLRDAGDRGLDPEPLVAAFLAAWTAVESEARLRVALRVAVPVGIFAYALQLRRLLGFLPAEERQTREPYMAAQLRRLYALTAAPRRGR
jgi:aminoglycoside/choline kinase family phosphotransferase